MFGCSQDSCLCFECVKVKWAPPPSLSVRFSFQSGFPFSRFLEDQFSPLTSLPTKTYRKDKVPHSEMKQGCDEKLCKKFEIFMDERIRVYFKIIWEEGWKWRGNKIGHNLITEVGC